MADEPVPQQEPSEVEKFAAALRQDLGGAFNALGQRLSAIEQRVAQPARPAAPQAPQITIPSDINDKLRERMIGDPLEYAKELVGVATTEAEKRARAIIEQERAQNQLGAAYQNFWGGFGQHNADVAEFQPQIEANLRAHGIDPVAMLQQGRAEELSRYADQAANTVRGSIAQRLEWQKQAAQQQRQNTRQAAGAPGSQFVAQQQAQGQPEERRDPRLELHDAVDELAAQRSKKMWHNIDTADYRSSARDRETKVAQSKYIASGGRR